MLYYAFHRETAEGAYTGFKDLIIDKKIATSTCSSLNISRFVRSAVPYNIPRTVKLNVKTEEKRRIDNSRLLYNCLGFYQQRHRPDKNYKMDGIKSCFARFVDERTNKYQAGPSEYIIKPIRNSKTTSYILCLLDISMSK